MRRIKESRFHDVYLPLRRDIRVILWAPHSAGPRKEFYTGTIVREISQNLGISGVVATVSRVIADLNRSRNYSGTECSCPENFQRAAVEELYSHFKNLFSELGVYGDGEVQKETLLLGIHGIKDEYGYGVVIGTRHGKLCPSHLREKIRERLELSFRALGLNLREHPIVCEEMFPGHESLELIKEHFGEKLQIVQIEISKTLRSRFTEELTTALLSLVLSFKTR